MLVLLLLSMVFMLLLLLIIAMLLLVAVIVVMDQRANVSEYAMDFKWRSVALSAVLVVLSIIMSL